MTNGRGMNASMIPALLLFLTGASLLLSADTQSAAKIQVPEVYKAGDSWTMQFESRSEQESNGAVPGVSTSQFTVDLRTEVSSVDKGLELETTVLRIRDRNKWPGDDEKVFDTDSPVPNAKGKANTMLGLVGLKARFAIKRPDAIEVTDGIEKFAEKFGFQAGSKDAKFVEGVASDILLHINRKPTQFLPTRPLAAGDTWKLDKETAMVPLGTERKWSTDVQCSLKKIEDGPDGKRAQIEFAGTAVARDDREGVPAEFREATFKVSGLIIIDLGRSRVLQSEVQAQDDSPTDKAIYRFKAVLATAGKAASKSALTVPSSRPQAGSASLKAS